MKSIEDIWALYQDRSRNMGSLMAKRREVRDAYNGDVDVPLPELDRNEQVFVANLLQMGLDQTAQRIASTTPNIYYPSLKPGMPTADKNARYRRLANLDWWQCNRMQLLLRKRARYYLGYSTTAVVVRPDDDYDMPKWDVKDPLGTFPPTADPFNLTPPDCIFVYTRSWAWLQRCYPDAANQILRPKNIHPDYAFQLVEYLDCDETVLLIAGEQRDPYGNNEQIGVTQLAQLERVPNRAGCCPVVIPGRITLDRPLGQFEGMLGMFREQSMLAALENIAMKRSVFPDQWAEPNQPGRTPKIVKMADGLQGEIGIVADGGIKELNSAANLAVFQGIDRLERAQRLTAGIPAEYGGESTTNIRTGRRGDQILSAIIDFPIQEAQESFAASLEAENKIAVAVAKAYWGNTTTTFFYGAQREKSQTYVPNQIFETDTHTVTYAHAGADANNLVIGMGQRIGVGTMSKRTAMEIDPLIDDPVLEHDRIIAEGLEAAGLQSIQTQAAQGAIPPQVLARTMELVASDQNNVLDAFQKASEEAKTQQQAPEQPNPAPPGGVTPDQMAAENQPGQPIMAPPGSLDHLRQLMGGLNAHARGA